MGYDARRTHHTTTSRDLGRARPSARTTLRADASSASVARRFVRDVLANRDLEPLAERAALLTSELVTNAVLYADSEVGVEVVVGSPCVRVEVRDSNPEPPVHRRKRPDEAVPGRGLQLVEAMADDWGTLATGEGKCVWFELRTPHGEGPGEARRVMLRDVPARAYVALNLHLDQLLHELEVAAPPGGWAEAAAAGRLHRVLSRILQYHRETRASAWDQAQRAMGAPDGRVDIELWLPGSAPDSFRELVRLLEEADRLCEAGELLTLPATGEVRRLRRWLDDEVWLQLRQGHDPRRCPL